ncbi:MAG: hypothetical protein HC919_04830 [Oscillatoriales cyanobacterium SM2_2_1]|nr:hypothetical protein [Oscillatoriales cyanobacterium SM2_2_1]
MTWLRLSQRALYLMQGDAVCSLDQVPVREGQVILPEGWFTASQVPERLVIDFQSSEPLPCQVSLIGRRVALGQRPSATLGVLGLGGASETTEVQQQIRIIQELLTAKGAEVFVQLPPSFEGVDCFVALQLNSYDFSRNGHGVVVDMDATPEDLQLARAIAMALDGAFPDESLAPLTQPAVPGMLIAPGIVQQAESSLHFVPDAVPGVAVFSYYIDAIPGEQLAQFTSVAATAIAQGISAFLVARNTGKS